MVARERIFRREKAVLLVAAVPVLALQAVGRRHQRRREKLAAEAVAAVMLLMRMLMVVMVVVVVVTMMSLLGRGCREGRMVVLLEDAEIDASDLGDGAEEVVDHVPLCCLQL